MQYSNSGGPYNQTRFLSVIDYVNFPPIPKTQVRYYFKQSDLCVFAFPPTMKVISTTIKINAHRRQTTLIRA
jgi:hypothetical protein